MEYPRQELSWSEIETVLLDMDGTLLDLAFDNFFWLELVPAHYAESKGLDAGEARAEIARRYAAVAGSLPWYCIDHWSRELDLDIRHLKWSHRHRIRYLPMVPEFLGAVRARGKRLLLVTNAHRETLAIKIAQTGLDAHVDLIVSSHDLAAPKESLEFWRSLETVTPFDPARSLLIEDSLPVLAAARSYGIRHVVAIRRPDSGAPPRDIVEFTAVDGVADLI
jgi:5'-nucleotidase